MTSEPTPTPEPARWADLLGAAPDLLEGRTVEIPLAAFDRLVAVAMHVSVGRSFAFHQGRPYPDVTARRALGELDDQHLLDDYRLRHQETPDA